MGNVGALLGGILLCCAIGVVIEIFNGKKPSSWGWFEWAVIIASVVWLLSDSGCRNEMRRFHADLDDPYEYKGRGGE